MDVCRYDPQVVFSHGVYHRNRKQTRPPAEPHSRTLSSTHLTLNEGSDRSQSPELWASFRMTYNMWARGWSTVTLQSSVLQQQCFSFLSFILVWTCLSLPCLCPCSHPHVVVIYRLLEISSATSLLHSKTTLQVIAGIFYHWQLLMIPQLRSFPNLLLKYACAHDPCPSFFSLKMTKITVISMLGSFINISIL